MADLCQPPGVHGPGGEEPLLGPQHVRPGLQQAGADQPTNKQQHFESENDLLRCGFYLVSPKSHLFRHCPFFFFTFSTHLVTDSYATIVFANGFDLAQVQNVQHLHGHTAELDSAVSLALANSSLIGSAEPKLITVLCFLKQFSFNF